MSEETESLKNKINFLEQAIMIMSFLFLIVILKLWAVI